MRKTLLFAVLLLATLTNSAQMLNSNKLKFANINYVQFPTTGEIMGNAYCTVNLDQGKLVATFERAVQNVAGTTGGDQAADKKLVSSSIFANVGDLTVVINAVDKIVMNKEEAKKLMVRNAKAFVAIDQRPSKGDATSSTVQTLDIDATFSVYRNGELIYTEPQTMVRGYYAYTTTKSATAPNGMQVTASKTDADPEELAIAWAMKKIRPKYGVYMGSLEVLPYYVSGLDRDNKKISGKAAVMMVEKINAFQALMGTPEFNKELVEAITFWKGLETKLDFDNKKAEVNKKNIWQIQSNIAIAYFLSGEHLVAKTYMEKALASKLAKVNTKTSKSGNASFSSGGGNTYLNRMAALFIPMCENYDNGLKANPEKFVTSIRTSGERQKLNYASVKLGRSNIISATLGLEVPVDIYNFTSTGKKITGTVSGNGMDYNYKVNKVWYAFFQKLFKKDIAYVTTFKSVSNTKDKVKLKSLVYVSDWKQGNYFIRPSGLSTNRDFNLPRRYTLNSKATGKYIATKTYQDFVTQKNFKAISRHKETLGFPMNLIFKADGDQARVNFKFDPTTDIVLVIDHERDMPGFEYGKVNMCHDEVLYYDNIATRYHFDNKVLTSETITTLSVDRSRKIKLGREAKLWKATHLGQLLPTAVVDTKNSLTNYAISPNSISIDCEGKKIEKAISKDADVWTKYKVGEVTVTRTIL